MKAKKDRPASHFLPRPIEGIYNYELHVINVIVAVMMREPVEAEEVVGIQATRSNSFNETEDLRMLP